METLQYNPQQNKDEINFFDLFNVIRKRRRIIYFTLFIVIAVTFFASLIMTPVYQATAKLAIDTEASISPITGQKIDYSNWHSLELTFNTHFKLIKSRPVIQELLLDPQYISATFMKGDLSPASGMLTKIRSYVHDALSRLKKNLQVLLKKELNTLSEQESLNIDIEDLQKHIHIEGIRDTRLLAIRVESQNAEYSKFVANLLAKKYIEFDLASKIQSENHNLEWLNKEVYSLKKRLEDDEKKFYEYKKLNKVFSLDGKQKVIGQKITELNNKYLATRNKRQELDSIIEEIETQSSQTGGIGRIRSILNNSTIDGIYTNLTNLELEKSRLAKVFRKKHPKRTQIASEIAKVRNKLRGELRKEIANLKVQRKVLFNREKIMDENIIEFEKDALDTSGKELTYTMLQRNMETSQNLYDAMVAKIKEAGVLSKGASSSLRIVEEASTPSDPIKPKKELNLLLGIVLGLVGGVGLVFVLEFFDQSLHNEEDVRNSIDLPVLAIIPEATLSKKEEVS